MSLDSSPSPIPAGDRSSPESTSRLNNNNNVDDDLNPNPSAASQNEDRSTQNDTSTTAPPPPLTRSNRPSRACTIRAAARLSQSQQQVVERKPKPKKEQRNDEVSPQQQQQQQCSRIVTDLVGPPPPSQLPRWSLRSMWELPSVLNFLHVFRPLLNISIEFSAEEFETALITPNDTLSDIHIPLLKAIPPVTRMALTRDTWVTVLCRKLRDWWHWVADGDLPIVASHGAEVEVYKTLEPEIRVIILKALCDIRVEQEDIRTYIEKSLKHGVQISAFRKERIGGDSQGINYWYEDDPIIGHRLYREIKKVEPIKAKTKGSRVNPSVTYQWETVATNFDEFQDVSEKLFSSKNRTEASLGKKLKNDMLLEIEKVHKRKEKLLKKQHRQALLLDNYATVDGLGPGRSLRDRKPVTYTFDDYDRSINEAIKITKRKPPSPEPNHRQEILVKPEPSTTNGQWSASSPASQNFTLSGLSPESPDYDDDIIEADHHNKPVDRSNRRRQRPQRYSEKEFVEAVSDNEADFDSDDDIVGEAIYDEEYLRKRKQRRTTSSSSEGDDEYHYEEENGEDEEEEEEEEEDEDSLNMSEEDSDQPRKLKKFPDQFKRRAGTEKLRSVGDIQSGLRRSKRAARNRVNYRQYELSESEPEPGNKNNNDRPEKSNFKRASKNRVNYTNYELSESETEPGNKNNNDKPEKSNSNNAMEDFLDASENGEYSTGSRDSGENDDGPEVKIGQQPIESLPKIVKEEEPNVLPHPQEKSSNNSPSGPARDQDEVVEGVRKRRFLDLNELAPASAFDDGPNNVTREDVDDDNTDHF